MVASEMLAHLGTDAFEQRFRARVVVRLEQRPVDAQPLGGHVHPRGAAPATSPSTLASSSLVVRLTGGGIFLREEVFVHRKLETARSRGGNASGGSSPRAHGRSVPSALLGELVERFALPMVALIEGLEPELLLRPREVQPEVGRGWRRRARAIRTSTSARACHPTAGRRADRRNLSDEAWPRREPTRVSASQKRIPPDQGRPSRYRRSSAGAPKLLAELNQRRPEIRWGGSLQGRHPRRPLGSDARDRPGRSGRRAASTATSIFSYEGGLGSRAPTSRRRSDARRCRGSQGTRSLTSLRPGAASAASPRTRRRRPPAKHRLEPAGDPAAARPASRAVCG